MELSDLIGRRVALRHVVGERDGRPLFSDAVGDLTTDGDGLVVATRRGPVRVTREAVAAVRAVPPAPPRRPSLAAVARLEGLCADAWPALHEELLGAWRLRAAAGYTGRANSALAIGSPGVPTPDALAAVRAFAARHGIGPRVQVPMGSPWDKAVAAEGWVLDEDHAAGAEVTVLVAELVALQEGHLPATRRQEGGLPATAGGDPSSAWWGITGVRAELPGVRHVVTAAPRTAFLTFDGAAALRVTLVEDHAHFSLLAVEPAARRRGLAAAIMTDGAAWAREHGARWGVLQVALHNVAARALYDRLGFTEHHRYRYLVPEAVPPPAPRA